MRLAGCAAQAYGGRGGAVRLVEWLVDAGVATAGEARRTISEGDVEVGGCVVRDVKALVDGEVRWRGQVVAARPRLLAWHKPVGVLSTRADPWGRRGLDDVVPAAFGPGWHPVGRLDMDTSGLLLFSRDGALTQRLLHPKRAVEREYVATVEGTPGPELAARLAAGVETAEGTFPAKVLAVDGDQVRLVVGEGKYRMVRRILANAGHPVRALHRVRYGDVDLGDLAPGAWRPVWTMDERATP